MANGPGGRHGRRIDPAVLQQYVSLLRPGAVIRLYQPVAQKTKRHVLIFSSAERSVALLINTRPAPFILNRPALRDRQVLMPAASHSFMEHDSYIACHDTVSLPRFAALVSDILDGHAQHLGYVSESLRVSIVAAARGSSMIAGRDMDLIEKGFGAAANKLA